MKKALWMVAGMTLATTTAVADQDISKRLDADSDGEVTVINTSGEVEIEGWSRNEVEVSGRIGDDVEEFVFERDGDEVLIKVRIPKRSSRFKDTSADLYIKVPKNSSLEVSTISADIDIAGVHGTQELQAISGDIETECFESDIEIESVSGDIDVEGDGKAIDAEMGTVSGDISAYNLAGSVEAGSVSGELTFADGSFYRSEFETVNGDIVWQASLEDEGKLYAETVNGSIDIEFDGDVSAEFDIETFNGRIDNCFGPKAERTSKYAPGWELRFEEGGGSGRVSLATLNGGIRICK